MALRVPISLVRSVTLTNIMFIKAIDAPNKVMMPMIKATTVTMLRFSIRLLAMLSLRIMLKLSRSLGESLRTLRMMAIALPSTAVSSGALGLMVLMV